jgi:hypothetical protein
MFRGWINKLNQQGMLVLTIFIEQKRKWQVKMSGLANRSPKNFNIGRVFNVLNNLIWLTPEGDFFHGSRLLGLVPFTFTLGGLSPCRDLDLLKIGSPMSAKGH